MSREFRSIESAAAIARAQSHFESRVREAATRNGTISIGYQGGGGDVTFHVLGREGIWVTCEDARNRYWNALFLGNPYKDDRSIIAEVNPPKMGINRRVSGAFVSDANGTIYLAHRGGVAGGRKGIGKRAFLDWYPGVLEEVHDGDAIARMIVIGALDDPKLFEKLATFVRNVAQFKDWAVSRARIRSGTVR